MSDIVDSCIEGISSNFFIPAEEAYEWDGGKIITKESSLIDRVSQYTADFARFVAYFAFLPFAGLYVISCAVARKLFSKKENKKPEIDTNINLPEHFGFADSLFQTSGLGTTSSPTPLEGECNWQKWLNPKHIEGTEDGNYTSFFVDVLNNPEPFIDLLKKTNSTAYRFSLERAVIEPQNGRINEVALEKYRHFIARLKEEGIEPYVTLHHFVHPQWFEDLGGFEKLENMENFISYSNEMMKFMPEVKNWMTFNEPGVFATQGYVFGKYPPGKVGNFHLAGRVMINMIIAHCSIFKRAKDEGITDAEISFTHQYLSFVPLNGNLVERVTALFFTNLFNNAIYNFFLTGHFSLKIPFSTNLSYSIPLVEFSKYGRFMDFVGVQFYGRPRLKIGFNWGEKYPGHETVNKFGFTFGSTVPKNKDAAVMSFGIGFYPGSIEEDYEDVMKKAIALSKPLAPCSKQLKIAITETGRDAMVQKWGAEKFEIDNDLQKNFFERILPIVSKYRDNMKALLVWTLVRDHLEWERGRTPSLGQVTLEKENGIIKGHRFSEATKYLSEIYGMQKTKESNISPAA